jgi:ACS family glucarate transporter-like MFS transporter
MAFLGSAPYWVSALVSVIAGWVSDALIRKGRSATLVRKSMVVVGLLLSTAVLPAAFVPDVGVAIGLICLAYVALGVFGSNYWTISQTLAGSTAVGKWVGLQSALGGATGIAAPLVTGLIVQTTGNFQLAFIVTAVVTVIGAASYLFAVGPVVPLSWRHSESVA